MDSIGRSYRTSGRVPADHAGRRSVVHRDIRAQLTLWAVGLIVFLLLQQVFGAVATLTVILLTGGLMLLYRDVLVPILLRGAPFLAFGLWAMTSYFWSSAPDVSLRYGFQLLLTITTALMIAATLPARKLPQVLFFAAAVILAMSVLSGRQGMSDTGPVLIGLTGSKNQFGYLCLTLIMSSYAVILGIGGPPRFARWGAVAILPVAILFLLIGKAAAAQIQFLGGTALLAVLVWATHVSRATRAAVLGIAAIVGLGTVAAAPQIEQFTTYVRQDVLKKDATLTGRTELWARADSLIEQRPLLGWGYRSTWLGDNSTTRGLLRWANLTDGKGFNFHNLAREMWVDLGIVGLVLLMAIYAVGLVRLGLAMYLRPTREIAFLLTLATLVIVIRANTEMNIGPFLFDTLMIFTILAYAAGEAHTAREARPRPDPSRARGRQSRRPQFRTAE